MLYLDPRHIFKKIKNKKQEFFTKPDEKLK